MEKVQAPDKSNDDLWNEELAEELHKPVRRKFPRRKVIVHEIDDIWSCDLVEMQEWSKENKGCRYMLNVIDVFSKYAWSIPIQDKKATTVLQAFREIVSQSNRKPKHIWVDEGKEFYNKNIDEWINSNNIVRYSTHGEQKSVIVERFNRTLKTNMWKKFTAENTRNWINSLPKLLLDYNNKVHSTIKMTPAKASLKENEVEVWNNINGNVKPTDKKPKFKEGDNVRISRIKATFEKGYLPNWSEELFTVVQVKNTNPFTYILKDAAGTIISGSFYTEELQKSKQDVYRIEKIISKKKIEGVEHGFVKWIGYSDKFNQWIPMKDIISTKENL
jgi:hypothetical protein